MLTAGIIFLRHAKHLLVYNYSPFLGSCTSAESVQRKMGSREEGCSCLIGVGPWLTMSATVSHYPPRQGEGGLVGPAYPERCYWQGCVLVTGLGLNKEQGPGPATPCGDARMVPRTRQMFRQLCLFALRTQ